MALKCGIVGLPNVGKSTLFNALTKAGIEAANYPFCTIDPNVGIVPIPDTRLDRLAALVKPAKVIPAAMEFVDIAGLVAGAAQGEGLGNQFLTHIRETTAILHVVRCFNDDDVIHVSGKVDPLADIETINIELALSDTATVDKAWQKAKKMAKSGDKAAKAACHYLAPLSEHLNQGLPARCWPELSTYRTSLNTLPLLTLKPILYVANVDEQHRSDSSAVAAVGEHANTEGAIMLPLCVALEAEIAELPPEEANDFLIALEIEEPGLNRVIAAAYRLLGLHSFFTAGEKEVRAWTLPIGANAVAAASVIHSDFARGFIRAEVISFDDYLHYQGEQGARDAGRWRLEGKDYIVQDGDIIHFRFNV